MCVPYAHIYRMYMLRICEMDQVLSVQLEPTGGDGRVVGWLTSAAVVLLMTSICRAAFRKLEAKRTWRLRDGREVK